MRKDIHLFDFSDFLPLLSEGYGNNSRLQKKITVSGYVRDNENGEMLAGVTIFDQ